MKERPIDPRMLSVPALCQDATRLAGQRPLGEMRRLHDSLFGAPPPGSVVEWSAQGSLLPTGAGEPEVWLHLQGGVGVTLQCQRCLQAVEQALVVDRRFRFVRTEQEAERMDEVSEDDVLVLMPRLDLFDLLEDELILALPLVPRHPGACPSPLPLPLDDLPAEASAPNPFAALAALRTGRRGSG